MQSPNTKLPADVLLNLSQRIENILVERNLRGMQQVQTAIPLGYCLRAAQALKDVEGHVLIGTGFPVIGTFETDGPIGAIALYDTLEHLGATPVLVCGNPIAEVLSQKYRTHTIKVGDFTNSEKAAQEALQHYQPEAIIAIERPGQAADGCYYNMRGEDISAFTACFDAFMKQAQCPTLAIGDGGNEIGMGNVYSALANLNIVPAATGCGELIVADVSNWGAYGLIAFLSIWHQQDLLSVIDPKAILRYLSASGSVDGVTRLNELSEDGLPLTEGLKLINKLSHVIAPYLKH